MSLLRLESVTRSVELPDDAPLEILKGVDLEVSVGDHVSIVGRSGSGKSTLLNLLGLLDTPTSGEIYFDDQPVRQLHSGARDRKRGRDIGFIFQQFNLLSGRTALENVMTPLLYATGSQFWRRRQIATEMLERMGLGERLTSMPEKLSGGEQQRVAIARALVRGPRTSARAIATRCCSPPESCSGIDASRSPRPMRSSIAVAICLRFQNWAPVAYSSGVITFSRAVRPESRLNCWKMNPMSLPRLRSRAPECKCFTGSSSR